MNRSFSFKDRLPWMIAYQGYRILAAYSYTSLPRFACCRQLIRAVRSFRDPKLAYHVSRQGRPQSHDDGERMRENIIC